MEILVGIHLFVCLMLLRGTQGKLLDGETTAVINPNGITKIPAGDKYEPPPPNGWPGYTGDTTKPGTPLKEGHFLLYDIDPQVDFCEGGALGSAGSTNVIKAMNKQRKEIERVCKVDVIISMDTHTPNHISFAAAPRWAGLMDNTGKPIEKNNRYTFRLMKAGQATPLWTSKLLSNQPSEIQVGDDGWLTLTLFDVHCVFGTPGHALHPDLIKENSKFFIKGMDELRENYSAAPKYDNEDIQRYLQLQYQHDPMFQNALIWDVHDFLAMIAVTVGGDLIVVIRGFVYEYCVKSTAITLAELGYKVYIVVDAIAYFHPPAHSARIAADTELSKYPNKIFFVKSGDLQYIK